MGRRVPVCLFLLCLLLGGLFAVLFGRFAKSTVGGNARLGQLRRCGRKVWSTRGVFDHAVVLVEEGMFVWTLSNNLTSTEVVEVDSETLNVKLWQSGAWRRQHDPDWQPAGEITVYDNRWGRNYSQIVSIAPASHSTHVVFDERLEDFCSPYMAENKITKAGNVLITSPRHGRAFGVDRNGMVVFEIFNNKPRSKDFGHQLSKAIWLSPAAFDFTKGFLCAS